jgi:aryl-alcohol dehydrogenase-like predicted oxidoreductase
MLSKIALGTAQFGLDYGIANKLGQIKEQEVSKMLELARAAKIDTLDTAIAYGNAERLLGELGVSDFRVVTKVPSMSDPVGSVLPWMLAEVEASLKRLKLDRLYGLILHNVDDLTGTRGEEFARALLVLRERGHVAKIGVSIYRSDQLPLVMQRLSPDLIQAPLNVFDRRLAKSGWLDRLSTSGTEVHIRSVFLQGLLLMPLEEISQRFESWRPRLVDWEAWVNGIGLSKTNACLSHVQSYSGVSRIVLGFDSSEQLLETINYPSLLPQMAPDFLATSDELLINPATWSST